MPTVGEIIIETLVLNGVDRVFCVPGESYLGLLDPLFGRHDIDTVVCRHEAGAGFMALADARLTHRPGVAMVSRGPGACNASIAVHTAQQDEVPFILLVGQVAAADVRRGAFQEIDYGKMFGSVAKWTFEVTDPERIAEVMLRAIRVATTGVPGPVVIALAEDALTAQTSASPVRLQTPIRTAAASGDVQRIKDWIRSSEKPLVIAGPEFEPGDGRQVLLRFLEDWHIPAIVSFRRQDLLPNAHRLYMGDMGLKNPAGQMALLRECDLLLVLGAQLGDITTQGYTFPSLVRPEMRLVHVHSDHSVLGTHFAADLALACDPRLLAAALEAPEKSVPAGRSSWLQRLKAEREAIARPRSFDVDDGVPFETIIEIIGRNLPGDAIVTADAGTFAAPVYRIVPFSPPQRLLTPIAGAMGFGVPAAVAAALREPGRPVICLVGDGGFLMTGNELAVALERGLSLKVILSENGIYGSIRIHQERDYPGRIIGTGFRNPDLELMGRAFGMRVTRIGSATDLGCLAPILNRPGGDFVIVESSLSAILPPPRPHVGNSNQG